MLSVPPTVELSAIDALLPQTQCQRCGYADCLAYASAMHAGEADINRCPPGGDATRIALSQLLLRDATTLPALADDVDAYAPEQLALIDEAACIGCAKCLPVCPTDAIVGASKRMHTVIAADCTGCELCIIACPVDCISLVPKISTANAVHATLTQRAPQSEMLRNAYASHKIRFAARADEGLSAMLVTSSVSSPSSASSTLSASSDDHSDKLSDKKTKLAEIMARARAKLSASSTQ
jgi:Na+-translocating ferredoxin:NAD+ oxidoreductase subunit B